MTRPASSSDSSGGRWVDAGPAEGGAGPLWWRDGAPCAALPRGWLTGEAVYETLLAQLGGPLPALWRLHLRRFERSARLCQLPWPGDAHVTDAAQRALVDPSARRGLGGAGVTVRLRLNLVAAGALSLTVGPARAEVWVGISAAGPAQTAPLRLALGPRIRNVEDPLTGAKRVAIASDLLARRDAVARGFDDVLLRDVVGRLSEASTSCLVLRRPSGALVTPAADTGALPSTTLALLREHVAVADAHLTYDELGPGWAGLVLNAVVGARPVACVDAVPLSPPPPAVVELARDLVRAQGRAP